MKKLLAVMSGVLLHLAVGSVYAWSVLTYPIINEVGWSFSDIATVFGCTIATLGFSAALLGKKVKAWGPLKSCRIATVLFLTGMLLTSVSIDFENLILLYIAYGLLVGVGTGIAYLTPIPVLITYYPEKKGTITGLIVMGFGLSSVLASYGYHYFINTIGIDYAIGGAGLIFTLLMLPSCFLLKPQDNTQGIPDIKSVMNVQKVWDSQNFRLLWMIFFINIFVGVSIISALAPMLTDLFEVKAQEAATVVAMVAVVNGVSRIFWSYLSDQIGRPLVFLIMIMLELVALCSMIYWYDQSIFIDCVIVIISCYGGMFACMPGYLSDIFGTKNLSTNLGYMLTAWGVAGFIGPKALAFAYEYFGNYGDFFYGATVLMCINLVLTFIESKKTVLTV